MKKIVIVFIVIGFGVAHAQSSSTPTVPASPAIGVESGEPSKEQKKALRAELQDEKDAVVSACAEESKAAGCGNKVIGKGLLKCIYEHKKASKDFKVSEGCKTAMKSLKSERKKLKN